MPSLPDLLQQGLKYHQAGHLHQAELIYRQILQTDPRHFDSIHLLGLIAHQVGRNDLAVDYLQQALRLNPTFPAAHNNMGNVWIALGKLDEAIAGFGQAVRLKPDYAEAQCNLGNALRMKGRLDDAIICLQNAIRLKPNYAEAHLNLANVLSDQGKLDDAITSYRQAARLKPDYAEVYLNLGNALRNQGKHDEAVANYRQAVRLKPDLAEACNNLGNALTEQARPGEALAYCQRAVQLKPDFAEAYNNLANALREQGKVEEAIVNYQKAVSLKPDFFQAYSNLGNAQQWQGRYEEALASCRQAVQLKPDFAEAHLNWSMPLLLLGNFGEGWAEYEWRWRTPEFQRLLASKPWVPGRDWDGSSLAGRTILLHAEQGLGDAIQFVRYAALLSQQGAGKVLLVCPPSLHRLMRRCQGISAVVPEDSLPEFDVQAHLLSLPVLLGTTSIERIPANVPYLDSDPELVARWRERLTALDKNRPSLRVGIVWQGSPTHKADRWRSVGLEQFAPLAQEAGVRLYSLQKDFGREQMEETRGIAVDLGAELIDLADTAAACRCLDLIICVDTAVAHLAGALGVPVWLALSKVPDWRWLLEREDSPWYPSMRLFRQAELGQWGEVFGRMKEALAAHPRRSEA